MREFRPFIARVGGGPGPRGSIYVPRNYDRANIPVSELENGRFPYNDRLRAFCEAQCRVYTSGRIHEFHVLPHQIPLLLARSWLYPPSAWRRR